MAPCVRGWLTLSIAFTVLVGCDSSSQGVDSGVHDAGSASEVDGGIPDAGVTREVDSGVSDASMAPGPDSGVPDAGSETTARILEVYYGLDMLPLLANVLCMGPVAGQDGVPVTFSVQLEGTSVAPEDFAVETATGQRVTPDCATLSPATEPLERRTVLLTGTFGTLEAQLRAVEVVGVLEDLDGNEISGLRSEDVTPLEGGPGLVLAERYLPSNPGIGNECPTGTTQVVQLVWGGGVTGPAGAPLGEAQRLGVSVGLENGSSVQPIALADDDPDNFVYACLDATSPAIDVRVAAGLFHDPGDDANPVTSVTVIDRTP